MRVDINMSPEELQEAVDVLEGMVGSTQNAIARLRRRSDSRSQGLLNMAIQRERIIGQLHSDLKDKRNRLFDQGKL